MTNWEELMSRPVGTSERPIPLPAGMYTLELVKLERREVKTKEGEIVPVLGVVSNPVEVGDDIDRDALPEGWAKRQLRADFWLRDKQMYRLDDFITKTMRYEAAEDEGMEEALANCIGREFFAYVEVRNDDDGEPRYNDIKKMIATAS